MKCRLIGQRASSAEIRRNYFIKRKAGFLLRDDGIRRIKESITRCRGVGSLVMPGFQLQVDQTARKFVQKFKPVQSQ